MAANDNLVYDYLQNKPQNRQPGVQYATGGNPNPNGAAAPTYGDDPSGSMGGQPGGAPNPNPNGQVAPPAYQIPTTDVGYDPTYQPTSTGMTSKSGAMPGGIDPALADIYRQAGVTPGDRGTGFVDWQYWQERPSQYDRLRRDLAGTGTDQPTGTPGSGPWQNSGRNTSPNPVTPFGSDGRGIPVGSDVNLNGGVRPDGTVVGGNVSSVATGTMDGNVGDLYGFLMNRAHQGLDVNPDSPVIKNQTDAFRANETRNTRSAISAAAERAGSNANIGAYERSMNEKAGQDVSSFEGTAMQHEVDARRAEIQQSLQLGANLLTEEQRQALQLELEQLSIQSNQFMQLRDLQERGFEFGVNRADYVGLSQ